MDTAVNILSSDEDERLLNFTMKTRETLVNALVVNGKPPEDKADKSLLTSLLDGMDRTILTKSRIKADSKISDNQTASAALIASVLLNSGSKIVRETEAVREVPMLPDIPEEITFVEGELVIGTQNNNIESFMAKFPQAN